MPSQSSLQRLISRAWCELSLPMPCAHWWPQSLMISYNEKKWGMWFDPHARTMSVGAISVYPQFLCCRLVHVEVSLNNAISFIRSDANITSDNCMSARVRWHVPS